MATWIAELGCVNAPIPRRNVRVALAFFDAQMPSLSVADAVGFLSAIDLSKPVARVHLKAGERLIGFRTQTESPFKLFFARRGSNPHGVGINTAGRSRGPFHRALPCAGAGVVHGGDYRLVDAPALRPGHDRCAPSEEVVR